MNTSKMNLQGMNKEKLQSLIKQLRTTLDQLESEVLSDPSSYLEGVSYEDILVYNETNDDDGWEGL